MTKRKVEDETSVSINAKNEIPESTLNWILIGIVIFFVVIFIIYLTIPKTQNVIGGFTEVIMGIGPRNEYFLYE